MNAKRQEDERDYEDKLLEVDLDKDVDVVDAADDKDGKVSKPRNEDPRQAIAKKYDEKQKQDRESKGHMEETDDLEEIEAEADEPGEPEKVEVKINGRTRMVDAAVVKSAGGVEAYQKSVAADEGFRNLAEEKARFRQEVDAFYKEKERIRKQIESKPTAESDGDDMDSETVDMAKKAITALMDGEEEEAAKLFAQITRRSSKPVDTEEIATKAADEVFHRQYQRELNDARQNFENDYPEIYYDSKLYNEADQETLKVKQEHPSWKPQQILQEAGKRVRDRLVAMQKAAGGTTQDKQAAKRSQTNIQAGSARDKPAPTPKPETNSEYITRLRKMRGIG